MSLDRVGMTLRNARKLALVSAIGIGASDSGFSSLRADELDLQNQLPTQGATQGATQNQTREPLRVKPLQVPDTSIQDAGPIGSKKTPEDMIAGRLPDPVPLPFGPDREGGWAYSQKLWTAPVYWHQPTYYEDVMLEHHGHERCPPLQPMLSGARFYSGIFFTPYLACLNPPLRDIPSAGPFRPGSAAPALRQRAPYDVHALGTQAVITGAGVALLQP